MKLHHDVFLILRLMIVLHSWGISKTFGEVQARLKEIDDRAERTR